MKDNLSIVILMIVFVMLVVMFPLYNFFERQDDMSYNLALRATTSFVEKVLNYGYLDSEMYDEFITELSSTGNLYDIDIEAHIQTITLNPDDKTKSTYITQTKIEYTDDIFSDIETPNVGSATLVDRDVENGMYKLNIGDGFYVKLKNSNTTMAGALFNSIISTSSTERIVINYGGVVRNNAWYKIDATYDEKSEEITESYNNTSSSQNIVSLSSTGTRSYVSSIPTSTEPQVVERSVNSFGTQQSNHVHTDSCYQSCNGSFEVIETYRTLIHTCYLRLRDCADNEKVQQRCPYSSFDGNCNWAIVGAGDICSVCGQRSTNMQFRLTCIYCSHEETIRLNECLNCRMTYYGKSLNDLEFVIGNHQANLCQGTEVNNLYRDVQVLQCKSCNAMYKKYGSYDYTCAVCKTHINYDEEIEGVEGQHNIIKICGYE